MSVTSNPTSPKESVQQQKQKPWRKMLYEDQGVPDNYVDDSFLEEMSKNLFIRHYKYWSTVQESSVIVQQGTSVAIYLVMYMYLKEGWVSPHRLFLGSCLLTLLASCLYRLLLASDTSFARELGAVRSWSKSSVIVLCTGVALSRVLTSLTETISTDTVYAMVTLALALCLLCHDYTGHDFSSASGALSLNAAMFASVCLASRLHSATHSFVLVILALQVFALLPQIFRKYKEVCGSRQAAFSAVLGVMITAAGLYTISGGAAGAYVCACVFVSFVCPAWLISLQRYKNNIHGPWDEAAITE